MSTFEDRLWSQLSQEHGDRMRLSPAAPTPTRARNRTRDRSRPALITGTALAATGLALAAVLAFTATTSTPPAYAVTTNPDGTVTVTLNDISALTGLNAELARDGLDARAVPLTATCPVHAPLVSMPSGTDPSTYTVTLVPADIPAGYTAVVGASENASGQVVLLQGAVRPPVPTCVNSTPVPLTPISMAHASPAVRAALAKARRAAQAARAANRR
jgi:hypothetical protein